MYEELERHALSDWNCDRANRKVSVLCYPFERGCVGVRSDLDLVAKRITPVLPGTKLRLTCPALPCPALPFVSHFGLYDMLGHYKWFIKHPSFHVQTNMSSG
jgi:hypothetical protein